MKNAQEAKAVISRVEKDFSKKETNTHKFVTRYPHYAMEYAEAKMYMKVLMGPEVMKMVHALNNTLEEIEAEYKYGGAYTGDRTEIMDALATHRDSVKLS